MGEKVPTTYGSIRVRGTKEELLILWNWARELELDFVYRDLYDRYSNERIWSFDFENKESYMLFLLMWNDRINGQKVY